MRKNSLAIILACLLIGNFAFSQHTASTSKVWYTSLLKKYFPKGITVQRVEIKLNDLPCLPKDITEFDVITKKTDMGLGPAFQVAGTLKLGKIVPPFYKYAGGKKKEYFLILQGYLFSPRGKILWQQKGYPIGGAWVSADGDKVDFRLINSFKHSTRGCVLLVLAIGDLILSDYDESRTILGAKRINL